MSERPLRLTWFLLHAGYIRYFRAVIGLLAQRGHHVHLAFMRIEKDAGDARLAEAIAAEHANVTFGLAPQRRRNDGWRALAGLVRSLLDLSRYTDPRYAGAFALRARVARKLTDHVRSAQAIDPLTAWLSLRLVRHISSSSSAASSARFRRIFTALESGIPTSRRIDGWLREQRPDAVLVTPLIDFGSGQVDAVKSARAAGIPSGLCVASWDNLTGKGLIRVAPDRVFVWNGTQVEEAVDLHGVPRDRVVATGSPKFDEWFERRPTLDPAGFAAKVGLSGSGHLLYLCSSPFIAPDEVSFVREWVRAVRAAEDENLRSAPILVRPHPQNAAQWRGADLGDALDVAVWPRGGAQPDAGEARADFFDSIAHASAVVGINTSALIESAIVGKSVYTVLDERFRGTQEGTLHFHYLRAENGGFLYEARDLGEHVRQLERGLAPDEERDRRTRAFVEAFVRPAGLDRNAAEILAAQVEELAGTRPAPARRSLPARGITAALLPIAALGTVLGPAAVAARRARLALARR